jgi:DNA-binding NarL/FixJ family response regulator
VRAPPIGRRSVLKATTRRDGRLTAVERDAGLPPADGGTGPRVVVFSAREVIAQGLVGLLPDDWRARAEIAVDMAALERTAVASLTATILDAGHPEVQEAARFTRSRGGSVIVLLGSLEETLSPVLHEDADAIVVRDDVEALTLRVALAAGRLGMRLLPRRLPPAAAESVEQTRTRLDEPAKRALAFLADGLRDAEIARELNLSESAVRKLIQRTVRRGGARTRCEAVAAAVRDGELS